VQVIHQNSDTRFSIQYDMACDLLDSKAAIMAMLRDMEFSEVGGRIDLIEEMDRGGWHLCHPYCLLAATAHNQAWHMQSAFSGTSSSSTGGSHSLWPRQSSRCRSAFALAWHGTAAACTPPNCLPQADMPKLSTVLPMWRGLIAHAEAWVEALPERLQGMKIGVVEVRAAHGQCGLQAAYMVLYNILAGLQKAV
jgi:hypothetical protein